MATVNELADFQRTFNEEQAPLSVEGYGALFNPAPVRGPNADARYIGQAAMIIGSPYDGAVLDQAASTGDTKQFAIQQKDGYHAQRMQQVQDHIAASLTASQDVLNNVIATERERVQMLEAEARGPVAMERAYARQAAQAGDESQIEIMAHQVALGNELTEMMESQGLLEKVGDALGYLIPFGEAKDISDIADQVSEDPRLAAIAGADLESVLGAWKGLDVKRQKELYPALKEAVVNATSTLGITDGNVTKASDYLQKFFEVTGAEDLRDAQKLDVALSIADVTPTGLIGKLSKSERVAAAAILKNAQRQAAEASNPANIASKAGDVASAADHTIASIMDDNIAASMGTTRASAAESALPIDTSEWLTEVVNDDKLPGAVAQKLNEAAAKAEGYAHTMTKESNLMQIGVLRPEEKRQVMQGFFERMEHKGEDFLTENLSMENLKVVKEDNKGFTYSYTLREVGAPDEEAIIQTGEVQFRISDVTGDYSATVNDSLAQQASTVLSPTAWSKRGSDGDFNVEVKRAIQAEDLKAAYVAKSSKLLEWAAQPVSGALDVKARSRIDKVLEAGDEFINPQTQLQGRTFTPTELMAGVETKAGTIRLNAPKEMEAYYRFRLYSDATYQVENSVLRRELELGGFKNVKLFAKSIPAEGVEGVKGLRHANQAVARPYDDVSSALASVRDKQGQGLFDSAKGEVVDITDDVIRRAYEEGDVIVRMKKDWNTKGTGDLDGSGEFVQYARVPRDRITDLPTQVLNYRQGYVPKINEAKFMVSQRMPMIARGRQGVSRTQAMRAFDSLQDANKFREEKVAKFMRNHQVTREEAERVFPEVGTLSDMPFAERLEEAVGSHGGLYHGTRSKDEILFGLSGQQMSRVSPLEAFQRHAQHVGNFQSMNELRIARERRWLNTIRREFPDVKVQGFETTMLPSTPKGRAAERVRQQIREWNGLPTTQESLFNAMAQRLHDWTLNGLRNGLGFSDKESVKSMQWLMHSNPVSAIKAAVMHNLLGMFNLAQLYVQASGSLIAITKNPRFADAIYQGAWFHLLDNVRNQTALGKVYKTLLDGTDIGEDTIEAYKAYARTGLTEAVYNNADLSRMGTTGLGMTTSVLRSMDNLSLHFYRTGELTNRRISFLTEYKAWAARTGKKAPNDDELSEILEQTNLNMFELNAANRAWWQGGHNTGATRQLLGMATQFMQVGTKTLELIAKSEARGGFTNAQKSRILAGQAAMFGAAGVPLGGIAVQLAAKATGVEQMDESTADALNQGFVGFGVNLMLGSELEISSRFTVGSQVTQMVRDLVTSDDPIWLKALGPAGGGLGGRMWDAYKELKPLMLSSFAGDRDLTEGEIKLAAAVLSEIPSSGRSWWKYNLMHNYHKIIDRRSNTVVSDDFDYWTEIGALIGFTPSAETDTRMMQADNFAVEEQIRSYADARTALMHKAVYEMKLDPDAMANVTAAIQLLDETTDDYVQSKGQERIARSIYSPQPDSKQLRELKKFLERTAVDKITEDALLDSHDILRTSEKPFTRTFKQILDTPE